MIKGIKRVLSSRIFWIVLEILLFGACIIFFKNAGIRVVAETTPATREAIRDTSTNVANALSTPAGTKLLQFSFMQLTAYLFIPFMYLLIWMHRYLKWIEIRDLKREHEGEKKALGLLIPSVATGD